MTSKTYRNIVFSGKDVPYEGISDGKGLLFRGKNVELSINLLYYTQMNRRSGTSLSLSFVGSVHGGSSKRATTICEGQNMWSEVNETVSK